MVDPRSIKPKASMLFFAFSGSKINPAAGVKMPTATIAMEIPLNQSAPSLRFHSVVSLRDSSAKARFSNLHSVVAGAQGRCNRALDRLHKHREQHGLPP
jgi:hypothetical protein